MKKHFSKFLLIAALVMSFLLPAYAGASTVYDVVFDVGDFAEPIYIFPELLDQTASYEMDGVQIAEWNGSTRTFTVKGPLDVTTKQGFVVFDTYGFEDGKKNATIVIDGHVTLASEDGHIIDAWVGEDENGNMPFEFELTVTSKGYNAENPSASASSLNINRASHNGLQACVLNVHDLYMKELNSGTMGMFNMNGLTLTNVTIDSANSDECIIQGVFDADTVLDNVTIGSISAGENGIASPGTLTVRNSQISNVDVGSFALIAEREVLMENTSLTNASAGTHLITTFAGPEDTKIEIKNCELSSLKSGDCSIFSMGNITATNITVDNASTEIGGFIVTESQATVTDSSFNKVTTTWDYTVHGLGEGGVVMKNTTITNGKALERGAALGGARIQLEDSTITNYIGENIVSCSGDISIKDSTLQGVTTWSSVWAGGDIAITNTTLTATSTEAGAPGIYTDTGNFTLDGVAGPAPESPVVVITPPSASVPDASVPDAPAAPAVPKTGDNTPITLLVVMMLFSLALIIRNRKLTA